MSSQNQLELMSLGEFSVPVTDEITGGTERHGRNSTLLLADTPGTGNCRCAGSLRPVQPGPQAPPLRRESPRKVHSDEKASAQVAPAADTHEVQQAEMLQNPIQPMADESLEPAELFNWELVGPLGLKGSQTHP